MGPLNRFHRSLKDLERSLNRSWQKSGRDLKLFPELAAQQLEKLNTSDFSAKDWLSWLSQNQNHPDIHHYDLISTRNIHFTVLRNKDFFIDVYSWIDHTEIHAHHFVGAFKTLRGRFIQNRYSFEAERIEKEFALGKLELSSSKELTVGTVTEIPAGEDFIHEVFHFDLPSLSLCVRTPDLNPRYRSYAHPGLRMENTSLKRPDVLRFRAFSQLVSLNCSLREAQVAELLQGVRPGRLLYEALHDYPSLQVAASFKEKFRLSADRFIKKSLLVDIAKIRKTNTLKARKLELFLS